MTTLMTARYAIAPFGSRLCALHATPSAHRHPAPQGGLSAPLTILQAARDVFDERCTKGNGGERLPHEREATKHAAPIKMHGAGATLPPDHHLS